MPESEAETRRLGYARVSTYGQTLDAQLDQLRRDGCVKIYREKASGARADRRELLRMLKILASGDVVTVTRIDRLARSTFDLFAIVKQIVDAKGQFRSLAEPWADTATSTGAADDCRPRRTGRRGARPDPHPHRRRPQQGEGARAAHGPPAEAHAAAAERSTAAEGVGSDTCRACQELQCREGADFKIGNMIAREGGDHDSAA